MQFADTALVMEGGGMRNSYTAACVSRLLAEGVSFGWVGGISAGSSHTVNFLSQDPFRTKEAFVGMSLDPHIGGWGSFLRGRGYFDSAYIYEQTPMPGTEHPFDYARFSAGSTPYRMGATRADTGETVYFGRDDAGDLATLMKQVRASSTMPVFMRTTWIDGVPYVDGALGSSGGVPLEAAEADGFEKFLVLLTRPRDYFKEPVSRPQVLRRAFRRWPKVADALIARPARYNATKRRLLELEKQGRAQLFFPETMPVNSRDLNTSRLERSYALGEEQTDREWDGWMRFLAS